MRPGPLYDPPSDKLWVAFLPLPASAAHGDPRPNSTRAVLPLLAHLMGVDGLSLRLGLGPSGKPHLLPPHHGLHFNLAHAGGLVAVVATRAGPVGVDIEPAGRDLTSGRILRRFYTPAERAEVEADPDPLRRALEVWTIKEALAKAEGVSIYQARTRVDASGVRPIPDRWVPVGTGFGPRWIRPLPAPDGFLGTIAFLGSRPPCPAS